MDRREFLKLGAVGAGALLVRPLRAQGLKATSSNPKRAPGSRAYWKDDNLVVETSGRKFVLNNTGGRVWQLCDGRSKVGDIAEAISRLFPADGSPAHVDVPVFIGDMRRAGLVA